MPLPRALLAFVGVTLLCACGSDPVTKKSGQAGTSSDLLDQVLTECTDYAGELCASAAACCSQVTTFVPNDCVSHYVEKVCTPSAQLVAAGLATYDSTAADGCLAAHQSAYDTCFADWEETIAIRMELWTSCRVINGTIAESQGCDNDARCALPAGEVATSACVQGICRKIELLAEGAPCPFPNGNVSTCDLGLYCTANDPGETGTCVASPAEGEPCDPTFLNVECGLGSYCDLTDGVCRKATNLGGPSCTQDTECVSFHCDRAAQVCTTPITTAGDLCGGP